MFLAHFFTYIYFSNVHLLDEKYPTWNSVKPIISKSCSHCHKKNGPAPFSLVDEIDFIKRKTFIKSLIKSNYMPPWEPIEKDIYFKKTYALNAEEKETLIKWLDNLENSNEYFKKNTTLVKDVISPDLLLETKSSWEIPPELKETGHDSWNFRTFVFPVCTENKLRVRGLKYVSTVPQAITSGLLAASSTERAVWLDSLEEQEGYSMRGDIGWLPTGTHGSFGIGSNNVFLPNGFHWEWPKNSWLAVELSFRPTGKSETLSQSIGVFLENDSESRPLRTLVPMIRDISLPANTKRMYETKMNIPVDIDLVVIVPRSGPRCTSIRATITDPKSKEITELVHILNHNPHFRRPLVLKKPFRILKDSKLHVEWILDNTSSNAGNPILPPVDFRAARRTGTTALLLQAASLKKSDDQMLQWFSLEEMKKKEKITEDFKIIK